MIAVFSRWGAWVGRRLVNHHAFIVGTPRGFDAAYAKHFVLLEATTLVPTYALSMAHYFSLFGSHPARYGLASSLTQEANSKAYALQSWLSLLSTKDPNPQQRVWVGLGCAALQLGTFPIWLFAASVAPAFVHSAMMEANEVLDLKYASLMTVGNGIPQGLQVRAEWLRQQGKWHQQHVQIVPDAIVATILTLVVFFNLR